MMEDFDRAEDQSAGRWARVWSLIHPRRAQYAGALIGLMVGILLLTIGFWRTLLLALCTAIGWYANNPTMRRLVVMLYTRWRDKHDQ